VRTAAGRRRRSASRARGKGNDLHAEEGTRVKRNIYRSTSDGEGGGSQHFLTGAGNRGRELPIGLRGPGKHVKATEVLRKHYSPRKTKQKKTKHLSFRRGEKAPDEGKIAGEEKEKEGDCLLKRAHHLSRGSGKLLESEFPKGKSSIR